MNARTRAGRPEIAPVASQTLSGVNPPCKARKVLPGRICLCGCGRSFSPVRKHQVYFETSCRRRAWIINNSGPLAISQIKTRLDRIEKKLGIGK